MRRRACMPRQQSTSEDDSSCHSLDDPDRCLLAVKTEIRLDHRAKIGSPCVFSH